MSLLESAVLASSKAKVAETLGVSRTAVSLVISGKYPASTDKIAQRVLEAYGRIDCPFLGASLSLAECKRHHTSAVPTSSPRAMKQWRACQGCANNQTNHGRKL